MQGSCLRQAGTGAGPRLPSSWTLPRQLGLAGGFQSKCAKRQEMGLPFPTPGPRTAPSITLPVKQMQGPHSRRGSLELISPQQKCPGILGPSFKPSQEQKASLTAILGKSVNVSIPHFAIVVQNNQVNTSQHVHVYSVLGQVLNMYMHTLDPQGDPTRHSHLAFQQTEPGTWSHPCGV